MQNIASNTTVADGIRKFIRLQALCSAYTFQLTSIITVLMTINISMKTRELLYLILPPPFRKYIQP